MSTYSVRFQDSGLMRSGYAPSMAAVAAHSGVVDAINAINATARTKFSYAISQGGNSFAIFAFGSTNPVATIMLVPGTLSGIAVGALALVDDGGGFWRYAVVTNDGGSALTPDGSALPTTTPAAVPTSDNGLQAPPNGTAMTLLGTALDGQLWFQTRGATKSQTVVTAPPTTVAAVPPGTLAIVQTGGTWQAMVL